MRIGACWLMAVIRKQRNRAIASRANHWQVMHLLADRILSEIAANYSWTLHRRLIDWGEKASIYPTRQPVRPTNLAPRRIGDRF